MKTEAKASGWSAGINNRARSNRIPEGAVRDMVNLDPGPTLTARVGYEKVVDGDACRGLAALGNRLVFADGADLKAFDADTNTVQVIGQVASGVPLSADVFNDELFVATSKETLRYADTLRRWGVPTMVNQPQVVPAGAPVPGVTRLFAATYVNEYGEEGGTVRAITVDGAPGYTVTAEVPAGYSVNLYISAANGQTLYLQDTLEASGTKTIHPTDDGATLGTMFCDEPPKGALVSRHNASIAVAAGNTIYFTDPMHPHLVRVMESFVAFASPVTAMVAGNRGLFVSADKMYLLRGGGTDQVTLDKVLDYPAVAGTGTILADGRAAWMTRYGMASESEGPNIIDEPSKAAFFAGDYLQGTAGVVQHDGQDRLVVALNGPKPAQGGLAATDYYEAEVIRP